MTRKKKTLKRDAGTVVTTMRLPVELVNALDRRASKFGLSRTGLFVGLLRSLNEGGIEAAEATWETPALAGSGAEIFE